MPNTELAGWAAGMLSLAAFLPYNIAMIRGRTRPNRATWWIWTAVGLLMAASYRAAGATDTLWLAVSYVIGPGVTAVIALQFGEGGWTRFDRRCLAAAGAGVLLWLATSAPLVGLIIGIAVDFIGALPTIRKARQYPASEDRVSWMLLAMGATANFTVIREWTFEIAAHPVYMFCIVGYIAALVFRTPFHNKKDGDHV